MNRFSLSLCLLALLTSCPEAKPRSRDAAPAPAGAPAAAAAATPAAEVKVVDVLLAVNNDSGEAWQVSAGGKDLGLVPAWQYRVFPIKSGKQQLLVKSPAKTIHDAELVVPPARFCIFSPLGQSEFHRQTVSFSPGFGGPGPKMESLGKGPLISGDFDWGLDEKVPSTISVRTGISGGGEWLKTKLEKTLPEPLDADKALGVVDGNVNAFEYRQREAAFKTLAATPFGPAAEQALLRIFKEETNPVSYYAATALLRQNKLSGLSAYPSWPVQQRSTLVHALDKKSPALTPDWLAFYALVAKDPEAAVREDLFDVLAPQLRSQAAAVEPLLRDLLARAKGPGEAAREELKLQNELGHGVQKLDLAAALALLRSGWSQAHVDMIFSRSRFTAKDSASFNAAAVRSFASLNPRVRCGLIRHWHYFNQAERKSLASIGCRDPDAAVREAAGTQALGDGQLKAEYASFLARASDPALHRVWRINQVEEQGNKLLGSTGGDPVKAAAFFTAVFADPDPVVAMKAFDMAKGRGYNLKLDLPAVAVKLYPRVSDPIEKNELMASLRQGKAPVPASLVATLLAEPDRNLRREAGSLAMNLITTQHQAELLPLLEKAAAAEADPEAKKHLDSWLKNYQSKMK